MEEFAVLEKLRVDLAGGRMVAVIVTGGMSFAVNLQRRIDYSLGA